MPGQSDIRAGRAFVELYADDRRLTSGLNSAKGQMNAWAREVQTIQKRLAQAQAAGPGAARGVAALQQNLAAASERAATAAEQYAGRQGLAQRLAAFKAARAAEAVAAPAAVTTGPAGPGAPAPETLEAAGGPQLIRVGRGLTAVRAIQAGLTAILAVSEAIQGRWDKVNEAIGTLPLGFGQIYTLTQEILASVTGLTTQMDKFKTAAAEQETYVKTLDRLRSLMATAREEAATAGMTGEEKAGYDIEKRYRDRVAEIEQLRIAGGLRAEQLDLAVRVAQVAREAAIAGEARVKAVQEMKAAQVSEEESQGRRHRSGIERIIELKTAFENLGKTREEIDLEAIKASGVNDEMYGRAIHYAKALAVAASAEAEAKEQIQANLAEEADLQRFVAQEIETAKSDQEKRAERSSRIEEAVARGKMTESQRAAIVAKRLADEGALAARGISARGTFNPAAILGLQGGNVADRTAAATEATRKNTKLIADGVTELISVMSFK